MRVLRPFKRFRVQQIHPQPLHSSQRRAFKTTLNQQVHEAHPHTNQPEKPVNFYKTHGRAFAKVVTLAFLTYQITYWTWLTLETEAIKDKKNREIKSLEQEVRLLDEGRKSHKPSAG